MNVGIIGGGVFGLAAAIELRGRGHSATVFDQGKVPYENATSTDVAKGIRRTWYGDGGPYVELVERSAVQWRAWERRTGESLYHRTGGMKIMRGFEPGNVMYENWRYLQSRGSDLTIMTAKEGRQALPAVRDRRRRGVRTRRLGRVYRERACSGDDGGDCAGGRRGWCGRSRS